jgi:hypothetical protein
LWKLSAALCMWRVQTQDSVCKWPCLFNVDNLVPSGSKSVYTEVTVYDDDDIVMGGNWKCKKKPGVLKEGLLKVPKI